MAEYDVISSLREGDLVGWKDEADNFQFKVSKVLHILGNGDLIAIESDQIPDPDETRPYLWFLCDYEILPPF